MSVGAARVRQFLCSRQAIYWVLALAFTLRAAAVIAYGQGLNLHSDDEAYVRSAIWFLHDGTYSFYSPHVPTVHMMPGITLLLSSTFSVFGTGPVGLDAAKLLMGAIGVIGIYGIYLIGKRIWNPAVGLSAALLSSVHVPGILTNSLLLTETPFGTALVFALYFSIRAADTRRMRHALLAMVFVVCGIYFRPVIALLPLVMLTYLLLRRLPLSVLLRFAATGAAIVVVFLLPWWIRNEFVFHHFIPLTDGSGNPLLLGTYQGRGYPNSTPLTAALGHLVTQHPSVQPIFEHEQQWMGLQTQLAIHRIKVWWHLHPGLLLWSYLWYKPVFFWSDSFYWITIFHVPISFVYWLEPYIAVLGLLGWLVALVWRVQVRAEVSLVILTLLYFTLVYSIYFAFGRYTEPLIPLVLLGMTGGVATAVGRKLIRRRPQNERQG